VCVWDVFGLALYITSIEHWQRMHQHMRPVSPFVDCMGAVVLPARYISYTVYGTTPHQYRKASKQGVLRILCNFIAVRSQLFRLLLLAGCFTLYLSQVVVLCTQVYFAQELSFDVVDVVAVVSCRRRVRRVTRLRFTT